MARKGSKRLKKEKNNVNDKTELKMVSVKMDLDLLLTDLNRRDNNSSKFAFKFNHNKSNVIFKSKREKYERMFGLDRVWSDISPIHLKNYSNNFGGKFNGLSFTLRNHLLTCGSKTKIFESGHKSREICFLKQLCWRLLFTDKFIHHQSLIEDPSESLKASNTTPDESAMKLSETKFRENTLIEFESYCIHPLFSDDKFTEDLVFEFEFRAITLININDLSYLRSLFPSKRTQVIRSKNGWRYSENGLQYKTKIGQIGAVSARQHWPLHCSIESSTMILSEWIRKFSNMEPLFENIMKDLTLSNRFSTKETFYIKDNLVFNVWHESRFMKGVLEYEMKIVDSLEMINSEYLSEENLYEKTEEFIKYLSFFESKLDTVFKSDIKYFDLDNVRGDISFESLYPLVKVYHHGKSENVSINRVHFHPLLIHTKKRDFILGRKSSSLWYATKWDGLRYLMFVDRSGQIILTTNDDHDPITQPLIIGNVNKTLIGSTDEEIRYALDIFREKLFQVELMIASRMVVIVDFLNYNFDLPLRIIWLQTYSKNIEKVLSYCNTTNIGVKLNFQVQRWYNNKQEFVNKHSHISRNLTDGELILAIYPNRTCCVYKYKPDATVDLRFIFSRCMKRTQETRFKSGSYWNLLKGSIPFPKHEVIISQNLLTELNEIHQKDMARLICEFSFQNNDNKLVMLRRRVDKFIPNTENEFKDLIDF